MQYKFHETSSSIQSANSRGDCAARIRRHNSTDTDIVNTAPNDNTISKRKPIQNQDSVSPSMKGPAARMKHTRNIYKQSVGKIRVQKTKFSSRAAAQERL